jgi:hypothetical protein
MHCRMLTHFHPLKWCRNVPHEPVNAPDMPVTNSDSSSTPFERFMNPQRVTFTISCLGCVLNAGQASFPDFG